MISSMNNQMKYCIKIMKTLLFLKLNSQNFAWVSRHLSLVDFDKLLL